MNKRNMCFKIRKKLEFLICKEYFSIDRPNEWNKSFILALEKAMFENEVKKME